MKIVELRSGLRDLQNMLSSFGASKQAREFEALVDALAEFDELTVPEVVKRVKAINAVAGKKPPKPIDAEAVEECLNRLQASMHLSEDFDVTVDAVLKDKRLKAGELTELARRFGGSTPAKTTKPAVRAFLKERRIEMRRQDGLGATIDRMLGRTAAN